MYTHTDFMQILLYMLFVNKREPQYSTKVTSTVKHHLRINWEKKNTCNLMDICVEYSQGYIGAYTIF